MIYFSSARCGFFTQSLQSCWSFLSSSFCEAHTFFHFSMVVAWAILIFFTGLAFYRGKIFFSDDATVAIDSFAAKTSRTTSIAPTPSVSQHQTLTSHSQESMRATLSEREKDTAMDGYYARQNQPDVERPASSHGGLKAYYMKQKEARRAESSEIPAHYQNSRPRRDGPY